MKDLMQPQSKYSWKMFNTIAPTYDMVNNVLSFGIDEKWRNRVVNAIPANATTVLDEATGTGDIALAIAAARPNIQVTASDLSIEMMELGKKKAASRQLNERVTYVEADGCALPFEDNSFDALTIGFGIRNMENVTAALREARRVLKPGGTLLILEFSLPKNRLFRFGYLFYFRYLLPIIGGLLSQQPNAYVYLNKTVEAFPYGDAFLQLMNEAGFEKTSAEPLTFGIATLYTGIAAQ